MDPIIPPFISENPLPGLDNGPLKGLCFAAKDNMDTAKEITGYGNPSWAATHPPAVAHAICIEQLRNAGASLRGKTHSDELAYGLLGVNAFYGSPENPKAPGHIPGGSSSGSASAVAAGLVDFALGTDTGGSVRVPASYCGLWGYRPSHGLISLAGVLDLAPSYDTVGILARSGEILEKVMAVLLIEEKAEDEKEEGFEKQTQDGSKNTTEQKTAPTLHTIGDFFDMAAPGIQDALAPVMEKITRETHVKPQGLEEILAPGMDWQWLFEHLGVLLSVEIWNTLGSWAQSLDPKISPGAAQGLETYARGTDRDTIQDRLRARKKLQTRLDTFLGQDGVLCFPTTLDPAPRRDGLTPAFMAGPHVPRAMGVTALSSLGRTPQITVPVGESHGLPVGLSFMAGYGRDMALIRLCNRLFSPA